MLARQQTDSTFHIPTVQGFDAALLRGVVDGNIPAFRVEGYISREDRKRISDNFAHCEAVRARDNVPAIMLGANIYGTSPKDYLEKVHASMPHLESLFRGTCNPVQQVRTDIQRALPGSHSVLRPALIDGHRAGDCRFVTWRGQGQLALERHVDGAQHWDPALVGTEIHQPEKTIAVNLYPSAGSSGGRLIVWDCAPTQDELAELGLEHSGYPIPESVVEGCDHQVIELSDGDLVILNGNYVHAVEPSNGSRSRILINFFFTQIDSVTTVTWT